MRAVASHGWPIDFYSNTIKGNVNLEYKGFGFPLSKEGGDWDYATNKYQPDNDPWEFLGTANQACTPYVSNGGGGYSQMLLDIGGTRSLDTGDIIKWPAGMEIKTQIPSLKALPAMELQTASPAWTAMFVTVTNNVNTISIESQFTSANGSQGLLSVYWDTNVIGSLDEKAVKPGLKNYTFGFPTTTANSTHILGFRLDSFTNTQSSVAITNIVLESIGVTQPFSLSMTTNRYGGLPVFRLTGQSGFNYTVQASTNLVNWDTMAILVNTNGMVDFTDYSLTNYTQRFYRTVAPN